MQREWAGAVGLEWFKAELTKAARNFNENAPLVQQNGSFKKSYRILRRYGLDGYIQQKKRIDDVSDFNDAPELREAIIKFANETIFTPNPNDIPIWAQTPVGAMIFQLKSFPLMMQRLVIDSFRGAGADPVTEGGRRFAPLLMLATVGPASGMGVNAIKDIVQARGGEGNERQLRDRQFSRIASELGYEPELHGPVDSFLGWYFEGFAMMGGLGLVAELLHDTAVQADQGGAYGAMRTAGVIGGPSVGAAWSAYDVISGTQDFVARGNENGTGRERAAVRALAQRVPVLGGVRDFRENVTTGIAGEPGKPKKPSTSWGEQWDSGWSESGWGD